MLWQLQISSRGRVQIELMGESESPRGRRRPRGGMLAVTKTMARSHLASYRASGAQFPCLYSTIVAVRQIRLKRPRQVRTGRDRRRTSQPPWSMSSGFLTAERVGARGYHIGREQRGPSCRRGGSGTCTGREYCQAQRGQEQFRMLDKTVQTDLLGSYGRRQAAYGAACSASSEAPRTSRPARMGDPSAWHAPSTMSHWWRP